MTGFRFRQVGGNLSVIKYWRVRLGQEGRNLSIVNYRGLKRLGSNLIRYIILVYYIYPGVLHVQIFPRLSNAL